MDAKRRGGEGVNPEELIPDDRRDELRLFYYGTQDWVPDGPEDDEATAGDVRRAFDAGFYSALEELGIVEVRDETFAPEGTVLVCFDKVRLRDGAVLVRAKK